MTDEIHGLDAPLEEPPGEEGDDQAAAPKGAKDRPKVAALDLEDAPKLDEDDLEEEADDEPDA